MWKYLTCSSVDSPFVYAGTKVNGGYSQLDWFCVNYSSLSSLIGMLPIWRFKTARCIVTILSSSGSHDGAFTLYIPH